MAAAVSHHGASSAAALAPQSAPMKECCVCFIDMPATELVALVPCGHRCMCEGFWRTQLLPRVLAARLCPFCGTSVSTAVQMFDA
jgi:hypothetical protein